MSPDRLEHLKRHGQRWPTKHITVTCDTTKPSPLPNAVQSAIQKWNAAFTEAGIQLQLAWSQEQPANISVLLATLEPGCIAVAMPPNGTISWEHEIQINAQVPIALHDPIKEGDSEATQLGKSLINKGTIDLVKVLMHELGHSIGLKHVSDPDSIMFGEYTTKPLGSPSAHDIAMVRALYA